MSAVEKFNFDENDNYSKSKLNSKLSVADRKIFDEEPRKLISKNTIRRSPIVDIATVVIIVIIFAVMTFLVMRYANISEIKYEIFTTKTEIKQLENEIATLHGKIDNAVAIDYVEAVAIDQLGMQYPTLKQSIYIVGNSCYVLEDHSEARLEQPKEMRETVVENMEILGLKLSAFLNK